MLTPRRASGPGAMRRRCTAGEHVQRRGGGGRDGESPSGPRTAPSRFHLGVESRGGAAAGLFVFSLVCREVSARSARAPSLNDDTGLGGPPQPPPRSASAIASTPASPDDDSARQFRDRKNEGKKHFRKVVPVWGCDARRFRFEMISLSRRSIWGGRGRLGRRGPYGKSIISFSFRRSGEPGARRRNPSSSKAGGVGPLTDVPQGEHLNRTGCRV